MKPEIRKIVTRSTLFFGILAVSTAGIQLASWRNAQNAPDAVTASADHSPVIVLNAGHGNQLKHSCKMHAAPRGALLFLS